MPTRAPCNDRETARLTATVDLPTPAFAGADGDDVTDALERRLVNIATRFGDFGFHLGLDVFDARDGHHGFFGFKLELIAHRAGGRRQHKTKADDAAADCDVADHIERDDVFVQIRVFDRAQRIQHIRFGN
jgi:hypothetical protein